jgi:hypothetical protein
VSVTLPAIRRGLQRLLAAAEPLIAAVVDATVSDAILAVNPDSVARGPGPAWYQPALAAQREGVIGQALAVTRDLMGTLAPRLIASRAAAYFNPWFSPRRDAAGVLRRDRPGAVTSWPGQAGMASQYPRLLLVTESTAAHGAESRRLARQERSLVRWVLAGQHVKQDVCDEHAERDIGYGRGVYLVDDLPAFPSHPRCRCSLEVLSV